MIEEDNKTVWCGNLPEQVTEELLYELFLQAGPLEKVRIPRDRDGRQKNFAFITYCHEVSVPYAINLFRGTSLFHRTLSLQSRGRMAILPPPIRCYGPEPPLEFPQQANIAKQFVDMTEHLNVSPEHFNPGLRGGPELDRGSKDMSTDRLVMASLQGNWSHRHHPYRPKEKSHRDDYRPRDSHNDNYRSKDNRSKHWRERRNNKKGSYHR